MLPRVHFAYAHPLGLRASLHGSATQERLEQSVYYWWWEYLRRNEKYRQCCKRRGSGAMSKLYEDFGDVFNTDFVSWWRNEDRGARLFAEPPVLRRVEELEGPEQLRAGWDRSQIVVIAVPLNLPQTYLKAKFDQLLKGKGIKKDLARYPKHSKARYPVVTLPIVNSLKKALEAWDLRKQEPQRALWELAVQLRLMPNQHPKEGQSKGEVTDRKAILSVAYSKLLKKAGRWIEGAGKGQFPVKAD